MFTDPGIINMFLPFLPGGVVLLARLFKVPKSLEYNIPCSIARTILARTDRKDVRATSDARYFLQKIDFARWMVADIIYIIDNGPVLRNNRGFFNRRMRGRMERALIDKSATDEEMGLFYKIAGTGNTWTFCI